MLDKFWEQHRESCPWFEQDPPDDDCGTIDPATCSGQTTISYNQHVNDKRYEYVHCDQMNCPVFHWVDALVSDIMDNGEVRKLIKREV
jgi:hypothetical protein